MNSNVVSIVETGKSRTAVLSNTRAKLLAVPTTMAAVTAVLTDQEIVKVPPSKAVEQTLTELSAIDVRPNR